MTQMVLGFFFGGGFFGKTEKSRLYLSFHIHLIMLVQGFLTAIQRLKINETF